VEVEVEKKIHFFRKFSKNLPSKMSAPAALSPSTIASAAVAVARAAREYLDALSDEQAETVT